MNNYNQLTFTPHFGKMVMKNNQTITVILFYYFTDSAFNNLNLFLNYICSFKYYLNYFTAWNVKSKLLSVYLITIYQNFFIITNPL